MTGKSLRVALIMMMLVLCMACTDSDEFTIAEPDPEMSSNDEGLLSGGTHESSDGNATVTIAEGTFAGLADDAPAASGTVFCTIAYYDGEEAVVAFASDDYEYEGRLVEVVSAGAMSIRMLDNDGASIETLSPPISGKLYLEGDYVAESAPSQAIESNEDFAGIAALPTDPQPVTVGDEVALYRIPCGVEQLSLDDALLLGDHEVQQDAGGLFIVFDIESGCSRYMTVVGVIPRREYVGFTADPNPAQVNAPVTFDASASWDGYDLYEWDFDGDGVFDQSTDQETIQHTYATAGTYTVMLRATDSDGATIPNETTLALEVQPEEDGPRLTVVGQGSSIGSVRSTPLGIDCAFTGTDSTPDPCSAIFEQDVQVWLSPMATATSIFSHWGVGDCDEDYGGEGCLVNMTGDKTVNVYFEALD